MTTNHQTEVQMLNEYIVALQKQIKSIEVQRTSLIQEVAKAEQNSNKADIELRQLKNQFKELNTVLYRQNIEKTNVENKFKILAEQNQKLKKENQLKEQRITQLNNSAKDKSDQLAKQKNNLFLTTTFHTKQITAMDDKVKQAEKKVIQINQQKNILITNLNEAQEQLSLIRRQNEELFGKSQMYQKQVEQLHSKLQVLEKQIVEINNQKDLLHFNLQITNEQLTKVKYENQNLSMQLIHRSQNNDEAQKSFQNFIQNLKYNHEHENHQLRDEMQQLKVQIQQYKDSIDSLNNLLNLQRGNFEKEYQKSTALTEQVNQLQREIEMVKKQMFDQLGSRDSVLSSQEKQYQSLLQKWKDIQEELQRTLNEKESTEAYLNSKYESLQSKYQDDLRRKIDELQLMSNDFSLKTLELEEIRYELSETQKRELKANEEIKKREQQIESLTNNLSLKALKIEQLRFEVSEVEKKLQNKSKDYLDKERMCQTLLQKQSDLNSQNDSFRKEISVLKEQKNNEIKKLMKSVESQDHQISEFRKRQARMGKQLKDSEDRLARMYDDMSNTKQGSQKKLSEVINNLHQLEKDLEKAKRDYREKDEALKELTSKYELKLKQSANKEQEQNKKYIELEGKFNKIKAKLSEVEKQLEKKDHDYNKTVEKMSIQHNSEMHELKKVYQTQLKQLEVKSREQISLLSSHLQSKSVCLKDLELELNKMQMSSIQFTSNQSSMEKTITMLQRQLEESHRQNNSYHQRLFSVNSAADHAKEQIIEKDIKIISLNSHIQKIRKENSELMNEINMLRSQIDALENSTAYLKRQITSTLDKQQVLLKEIRSLKETNKEMTKVVASGSTSNLFTSQIQKPTNAINSARVTAEKNRSFLNLGEQLKNLHLKDIPTITESINEGKSRISSARKRQLRSLQKYHNHPSLKNLNIPLRSQDDHALCMISNDIVEEPEMIPSSSNAGSINSSFYRSSHASRKASQNK